MYSVSTFVVYSILLVASTTHYRVYYNHIGPSKSSGVGELVGEGGRVIPADGIMLQICLDCYRKLETTILYLLHIP